MIVGITGIFGSGKTSVSKLFKGFKVINVDKLYRGLIKKNTPLYKKVIKEFGKEILHPNGNINRSQLKNIVFSNKNKLKKLNQITHPEIIKKIKEKLKQSKNKNIVIDAPLLVEAKATNLVDKIIVVTCNEKVRISRLKKKGFSEKEIKQITSSQLSQKEKLKYADFTIDNSQSNQDTKKQVLNILKQLHC